MEPLGKEDDRAARFACRHDEAAVRQLFERDPPPGQVIGGIFAPCDPDGFARSLEERIGISCAVVDANDLGKAKVLGRSSGVCDGSVEAALLENPHGNSDEQTPVVVLKWRGEGENPLLRSVP